MDIPICAVRLKHTIQFPKEEPDRPERVSMYRNFDNSTHAFWNSACQIWSWGYPFWYL